MVAHSVEMLRVGLAPATLSALNEAWRPRLFGPGEDLLSCDTVPAFIHLIEEGRAKVWRPMQDGRAVLLYFLGAGEVTGLVPALRARPGPAAITAVTTIRARACPAPLFRTLLHDDPALAANVARLVSDRFALVVDRLADLGSGRADQHLARALLRLAGDEGVWTEEEHVTIPVTRQDLADMSGTSLHTASRTLSAWGERGIVGSIRGQVTLLDAPQLAELAAVGG